MTPYGFAFSGSTLVVSEAFGGASGGSKVSSYALATGSGMLTPVSASVPTHQTAACSVAAAGDHVYAANTGSASVTGYAVDAMGALTLLDPSGVTGMAGATPIDDATSPDGKFLFVLNRMDHSVSTFAIGAGGALTKGPDLSGLPTSAVGLVVR